MARHAKHARPTEFHQTACLVPIIGFFPHFYSASQIFETKISLREREKFCRIQIISKRWRRRKMSRNFEWFMIRLTMNSLQLLQLSARLSAPQQVAEKVFQRILFRIIHRWWTTGRLSKLRVEVMNGMEIIITVPSIQFISFPVLFVRYRDARIFAHALWIALYNFWMNRELHRFNITMK